MEALDRDTIFALYVRPRKKKKKKIVPVMSYRDIWFAHGRKNGKTWLENEIAWQNRPKPKQKQVVRKKGK